MSRSPIDTERLKTGGGVGGVPGRYHLAQGYLLDGGRYVIRSVVGTGAGLVTTYRAVSGDVKKVLVRGVVSKHDLSPREADRILSEMEKAFDSLNSFVSPAFVGCFVETTLHGDRCFFVVHEDPSGESLEEMVEKGFAFSEKEAAAIADETLRILPFLDDHRPRLETITEHLLELMPATAFSEEQIQPLAKQSNIRPGNIIVDVDSAESDGTWVGHVRLLPALGAPWSADPVRGTKTSRLQVATLSIDKKPWRPVVRSDFFALALTMVYSVTGQSPILTMSGPGLVSDIQFGDEARSLDDVEHLLISRPLRELLTPLFLHQPDLGPENRIADPDGLIGNLREACRCRRLSIAAPTIRTPPPLSLENGVSPRTHAAGWDTQKTITNNKKTSKEVSNTTKSPSGTSLRDQQKQQQQQQQQEQLVRLPFMPARKLTRAITRREVYYNKYGYGTSEKEEDVGLACGPGADLSKEVTPTKPVGATVRMSCQGREMEIFVPPLGLLGGMRQYRGQAVCICVLALALVASVAAFLPHQLELKEFLPESLIAPFIALCVLIPVSCLWLHLIRGTLRVKMVAGGSYTIWSGKQGSPYTIFAQGRVDDIVELRPSMVEEDNGWGIVGFDIIDGNPGTSPSPSPSPSPSTSRSRSSSNRNRRIGSFLNVAGKFWLMDEMNSFLRICRRGMKEKVDGGEVEEREKGGERGRGSWEGL